MGMTMSSVRLKGSKWSPVVISVQLRRRWTPEQQLEFFKQTNEPGSPVYLVASFH